MTDPSYRGQILVFTSPLIGNYGVPDNKAPFDSQDVGVYLESQGIRAAAVIVGDVAEIMSHLSFGYLITQLKHTHDYRRF